ncbi:hypothetical protein GCM10010869_06320 [Mesorhizobium tianshanense]|nr:hypothetical protein GCM10010869_06320 [Mesorhizobium tianshanense]
MAPAFAADDAHACVEAFTAKLRPATFISGQAKLLEDAAHLVALARSIALSVSRLAELLFRRALASSRSA